MGEKAVVVGECCLLWMEWWCCLYVCVAVVVVVLCGVVLVYVGECYRLYDELCDSC